MAAALHRSRRRPRELVIDDKARITADRIVVAAGARPAAPPVIADSAVEFRTSDTTAHNDADRVCPAVIVNQPGAGGVRGG